MLDQAGPLKDAAHPRHRRSRPSEVADAAWQALGDDGFYVLPHPEVRGYYAQRAAHPDAWLAGMNRLQQKLDHQTSTTSTQEHA